MITTHRPSLTPKSASILIALSPFPGSRRKITGVAPSLTTAAAGSSEASATVALSDDFDHPRVHGVARINGFTFNTFPFGDLATAPGTEWVLRDERLDSVRMEGTHRRSRYTIHDAFLDFTQYSMRAGARMHADPMEVADFYDMFHFDGDPTFTPYDGRGVVDANVDYVLGWLRQEENQYLTYSLDEVRATRVVPAPRWTLDELTGRLTELSGQGAVASLTAATALLLEAQLRGEPCAWILLPGSSFFPPDLAASGVDLEALVVVRVETGERSDVGTVGMGRGEVDILLDVAGVFPLCDAAAPGTAPASAP